MSVLDSIPPSYNDGFKDLGNLSATDFEIVLKALNEAPLFASIEKLAEFVSGYDKNKYIECEKIFDSIGSLYEIIESDKIKNEVAKDITEIAEELKLLGEISKSEYSKRVIVLLDANQIYYAFKAEDLLINYDNVFIKTKIVTDIRPIFELNVKSKPNAGIIVHNLSIHYQPNDEPYHKDITIALSLDNIRLLQDVLARAEDKEIGLKDLFEKAAMKNLIE